MRSIESFDCVRPLAVESQATIVNPKAQLTSESKVIAAKAGRLVRMGRYHVLTLLGEGGMGAVFEAYDPQLGRKVAIKVMRTSELTARASQITNERRARLVREARNLARVSHPNIVPIYDVGLLDDDSVFLAMELVAGQSLRKVLQARALDWHAATHLILQIGAGLAAAHAAGILHRDIKPENVMVGDDGRVHLLDFGLAKDSREATTPNETTQPRAPSLSTSELKGAKANSATMGQSPSQYTHEGTVLGTPGYMAPEQVRGEAVTANADLFALGCVCFEALTGKRPFVSWPLEKALLAMTRGQLKWPRRVPRWLRKVVARALAFAPEDRGPGVAAFLDQLRRGLRHHHQLTAIKHWALALVLPLGVTAAWWLEPPPPADPDCRTSGGPLLTLWNSDVRAKIERAFAATKLHLANERFASSALVLDKWRDRWLDSSALLCPSTRESRGLVPYDSPTREQSRVCLAESRAEVAALLEIWHSPTLRQVLEATQALASLSSPEACTDPQALASRAALPADPRQRQAALELRSKLSGIRMLSIQADYTKARRELDAITPAVLQEPQVSLLTEYFSTAADLTDNATGHSFAASIPLSKAALWATAANRPSQAAAATGQLWFIRAYQSNLIEEADELFGAHAAVLHRAGDPPHLVTALARNRGIWAAAQGEFEQAMTQLQAALVASKAAFGEYSPKTAERLRDLGVTAWMLGDYQNAVMHFSDGLAINRRILAKGHPKTLGMYDVLSATLEALGEPADAQAKLIEGWRECVEAGMPREFCATLQRAFVVSSAASGSFSAPIGAAVELMELEAQLGRRLDAVESPASCALSQVLSQRGETKVADEVASQCVAKLRAELHFSVSALSDALFTAAQAAFRQGDLARFSDYLAQLDDVLRNNAVANRSSGASFLQRQGLEAFAQHRPLAAALAFETSLADAAQANDPPQFRSQRHLDLAQALLATGDAELARHHAWQGLALHRSVEGIAEHHRVGFHEVLAQIAVVQKQWGEALAQSELARIAFDPAEVLDNRLAPIDFVEAQAWWALDTTEAGHLYARTLAQRSADHYRDWEGGAEQAMREVQAWLHTHR